MNEEAKKPDCFTLSYDLSKHECKQCPFQVTCGQAAFNKSQESLTDKFLDLGYKSPNLVELEQKIGGML